MSLAIVQWTYNSVIGIVREATIKHFIRPDYYFMSWRRTFVEKQLDSYIERSRLGTLCDEEPYRQVHDFLQKTGSKQ